jgi:hypothetical protein
MHEDARKLKQARKLLARAIGLLLELDRGGSVHVGVVLPAPLDQKLDKPEHFSELRLIQGGKAVDDVPDED